MVYFPSIKELAKSYHPHYYSARSNNTNDHTLVGYSDPIDLVAKYGTGWMDSTKPLWNIYYTYIDDKVLFHNLFDTETKTHLYPLIPALKNNWIRIRNRRKTYVSVKDLPVDAQPLWTSFWDLYDVNQPVPRGLAYEIQEAFRKITGTTPIDLKETADDFVDFLRRGYKVEQIIHYV